MSAKDEKSDGVPSDLSTMYFISNFHADRCCHPMGYGHRWLAMVLLYNLEKEMQYSEHILSMNRSDEFFQYHIAGPLDAFRERYVPQPWRMTRHEDDVYCRHHATSTVIDFMSRTWTPSELSDTIAENSENSWSLYADSKNKTGLISTTSPSHVSLLIDIDVGGGVSNMLKIGYLVTYDRNNSATALIWVDYERSNKYSQSHCHENEHELHAKESKEMKSYLNETMFVVNSHQNDKASVYRDSTFFNVLATQSKDQKYLHICLVPKTDKNERLKFKLLLITTKSL